MDTTKLVNRATGLTVFLVAAFAFTQSFMHIFSLGASHGQLGVSGPLLPLSVDGLLVSMSLILLYVSWQHLKVPWLARVMLWLGIVATLAANVGYGLAYGYIGALTSCWPAIAFIGSVETLLQLGKIKRQANNGKRPRASDEDPKLIKKILADKPKPVSYADPNPNVPTKGALKASAYHDITGKLPSIRSIRDELHCGQPKAIELLAIMRDEGYDLAKALLIRDERKINGSG